MAKGISAVNGRSDYAQTLGRGLRLLELLALHPRGLGVVAIAGQLGVHRTVAYRLIGTLREHKLVAQEGDGRYALGLGLLELAGAVRTDLRRIAEPHLAELAHEIGATAFLTVADKDEGVGVCVVEPRNAGLHVSYRLGLRHPLTVSAAGLAILAGRPPQPGERAEIVQARARGYAVTKGELQAGAWGLAAPLPQQDGQATASIGVVALAELQPELVAGSVQAAVEAIARHIAL